MMDKSWYESVKSYLRKTREIVTVGVLAFLSALGLITIVMSLLAGEFAPTWLLLLLFD